MKLYALCFTILMSLPLSTRAAETAPPAPTPLPCVTADKPTRSYYAAGSRVVDKDAFGGFATSDNYPRAITDKKAQNGKLHLEVDAAAAVMYGGKFQGVRLRIVNATTGQVAVDAADSALPMVMEARDGKGAWRPLEIIEPSFCGNSYHRVFLGPNQYWEFTAPRFSGSYKTKLRFRLKHRSTEILSNEFDGSIDVRQFALPPSESPHPSRATQQPAAAKTPLPLPEGILPMRSVATN